jgi:hypothetical protein
MKYYHRCDLGGQWLSRAYQYLPFDWINHIVCSVLMMWDSSSGHYGFCVWTWRSCLMSAGVAHLHLWTWLMGCTWSSQGCT